MSGARILGGVLVGALLGSSVTLFVRSVADAAPPASDRPERAAASGDAAAAPAAAMPLRNAREPAASRGGEGGESVPPAREAVTPLSPQLRAWATEEMRRAWRERRPDALPDEELQRLLTEFEAQVAALPAALAHRAAEALSLAEKKADAFAGGDGVALLQAIDGGEPEAAQFVASEGFARLFQPHGGGSVVAGPGWERGGKLASGSVLAFPAGVFEVGDLSSGNEPFPDDVTVRGVGMDATLLVVQAQSPQSPLRRFAIEDCTVFAENAITVMHRHPAVLSLQRVRVVGFDCGAGSAVALYLFHGMALLARGCRFEGGYGRAPQSYANLLDSRSGPRLARFEQCVFDRIGLADGSTATIVFHDCTMHELLDPAPDGPQYRNCRITQIDQQRKWDGEFRRRDLNDLFPQWRERLRR